MSRSKFLIALSLFLSSVLFMAACRQTVTLTPPVTTDEPVVEASAVVQPSATPNPSATATETAAPTETPTLTPTPLVSGPINFPDNVNPLTGLLVADPAVLIRNPIMVKIANFPRGLRPHSGLSFADIVFEHYIGVGATRFSAIFYGENPDAAGPVRSGRLVDAQLGNAYNSLFAFSSADPFVFGRIVNALLDRAVNEGPNTCPALCRTGTGDVNSVFADPALMTSYAQEQRAIVPIMQNLNGTRFDPAVPEAGKNGLKVSVQYSVTTVSAWEFDPASGEYLRFIDSVDANNTFSIVPLTDRLTGAQLSFANVVVLFAQHTEFTPTLHDIEILGNTFGRRALLFRDGQVFDVVWRAQGPRAPIQFFTLAGDLIALRPGQTWIHLVGVNSSAAEVATGEWQVIFSIP